MTTDEVLPATTVGGSWVEAMQAAIGPPDADAEVVRRACAAVRDRIAAARAALPDQHAHPVVVELLDLYDAAHDLLRRWAQAVTSAQDGSVLGAATADILLNDFRPVRPYAAELGRWISEHERRLTEALPTADDAQPHTAVGRTRG